MIDGTSDVVREVEKKCVCVSVTSFSAIARYNAHNKTYHRLQRDMI